LLLAVVPATALATWFVVSSARAAIALQILLLYLTLGYRSLSQHALPVAEALNRDDLGIARQRVGRMVSRDTAAMRSVEVARAAVESVLENGNDAVFAALLWFAIAGAPGALLYRLINTLDAMWGYRTPRYLSFGWAAARCDDVMNFVPARLTALTYALLGRFRDAMRCWRLQGARWESPNAGPVMAAGAGSLNLLLGGPAFYHGQWKLRPPLGQGKDPQAEDIARALRLVSRGILLWLSTVFACALAGRLLGP
jgi:adenosylcobinamide-phosphate synthase